jgi:hypothetical protein
MTASVDKTDNACVHISMSKIYKNTENKHCKHSRSVLTATGRLSVILINEYCDYCDYYYDHDDDDDYSYYYYYYDQLSFGTEEIARFCRNHCYCIRTTMKSMLHAHFR